MDLDRLEQALADFGAGYLLTTSPDGRVKVVTVEPTCVDAVSYTHLTLPTSDLV